MLSFKVEKFADIQAELTPLIERHWREVGRDRAEVPLNIATADYIVLEAAGQFLFITARHHGTLVGYIAALINTHLHYKSTKFAGIDAFYLEPTFRKGVNGVGLFTAFEDAARAAGVVKVMGQTKIGAQSPDISPLYQYLGWTETERLFMKVI